MEEDREQRKKRKREEASSEGADEADGDKEMKKNKKEKKDKKDKKDKKEKRQEAEIVEEPVMDVEEEVVAEESSKKSKKDKKDKKDKKERAEAAPTANPARSSAQEGNFYVENASTSSMSESAAQEQRASWNITIYPEGDAQRYKPVMQFQYLRESMQSLCPYVMDYIAAKKFSQPTPIQAQCWPPLLSGRDVIGIAMTGSGKTLAFLLPGIVKITHLLRNGGSTFSSTPAHRGPAKPLILILSPTRELAMQSQQVINELGGDLRGICIYGGVNKHQQRTELQRGVEIVVATPGRLMDLMQENAVSMSNVRYLVLDEADRMLDEGFEPAIAQIISHCPAAGNGVADRQTVMFSATWPESIRNLAEKYLRRDVLRVTVGSEDLCANHRVTQIVEVIQPFEKDRKLFGLLEKYHASRRNRVLIFVLYKKEAADLQARLQQRGYNVTGIHGDKAQHERTAALDDFKQGRIPLLIATDVAARGLDIPQVEYVINYTFPLTTEDYVHRIGRTGRGGATGTSHTFFTDNEKGLAGALVGVLQEANQTVPEEMFKFNLVTKKKTSKLYGDFGPKTELAGKTATKITFDA